MSSLPTPSPDPGSSSEPPGAAGLGVQFAGAIVMCVLLGQWLERRYGFAPWGVVGGAAVGFSAGFYALLRAAGASGRGRKGGGTKGTGGAGHVD